MPHRNTHISLNYLSDVLQIYAVHIILLCTLRTIFCTMHEPWYYPTHAHCIFPLYYKTQTLFLYIHVKKIIQHNKMLHWQTHNSHSHSLHTFTTASQLLQEVTACSQIDFKMQLHNNPLNTSSRLAFYWQHTAVQGPCLKCAIHINSLNCHF